MKENFIQFLKTHPTILGICWKLALFGLKFISVFVPIRPKTMLFASLGGRNFDDSPRAIYDEVLRRTEFSDWTLVWAFVNPDEFIVPRGEKVKIDSFSFFMKLLSSNVWVSNSGMDRGIGLRKEGIVRVETWHGTPIKRIAGEEHTNSLKKKKTHRGGY